MPRPKKLSLPAIEVLASMAFDGNAARITGGQLDRKLYVEVNAALEALGGKWNRKAGAHLFDGDPANAIDQVVVDGEFSDAKRDFELFETPPELAARIVEVAGIEPWDLVLEPSAGRGALVDAVYNSEPTARVFAVEVQPDLAKKLAESYAKREPRLIAHCGDFLGLEPEPKYNAVVMNPPFSRQLDIDHVTRALQWLAADGTLVAIMSAGTLFRQNRKAVEFRELVERHDGTIEALPPGTFKSSGTMVNTVLVEMRA